MPAAHTTTPSANGGRTKFVAKDPRPHNGLPAGREQRPIRQGLRNRRADSTAAPPGQLAQALFRGRSLYTPDASATGYAALRRDGVVRANRPHRRRPVRPICPAARHRIVCLEHLHIEDLPSPAAASRSCRRCIDTLLAQCAAPADPVVRKSPARP